MGAQARIRYPTKAAIRRAVETARELGIDVGGFEVTPEGAIRVLPPQATAASEFDRWKDRL